MKLPLAILLALCLRGPGLAQAPPPATRPSTPQHQPGVPAGHASGQTADTPPAEEKLDPAKEAAVRHLMDITQTVKLGDNIAAYLTNQVHDGMSRTLTPQNLSKFMDSFHQKFSAAAPAAAVADAIVPIYAKAFSIEDIQALIQFYESPLGQRVVKALPDVEQKSQAAGMQIEQAAALKVLRAMTDQFPELRQILPSENAPPSGGDGTRESAPGPAPNPAPATPPK